MDDEIAVEDGTTTGTLLELEDELVTTGAGDPVPPVAPVLPAIVVLFPTGNGGEEVEGAAALWEPAPPGPPPPLPP